MDIFTGAVVGLSGVIVGGILQYFTTRDAITKQNEWEKAKLISEKLEHIARISRDVSNGMSALYLNGITCVEEERPYKPESHFPLEELFMLLEFYAPELEKHYSEFVSLRDKMSDTIADLISGRIPKEKTEKQELNERLFRASVSAKKIGSALIIRLSEVGRSKLESST